MSEELKKQIKDFWNAIPCGTGGIKYAEGTVAYYEEISRIRYQKEIYLKKEIAEFNKWNQKKLLEVGCGVGSDLVEYAKNGALVTAIDLSKKSVELTQDRLKLYGLKGEVYEADAESMPFEDNRFDVVVSFGVLHHTPDMAKAISEIYRVLKPGGEIRIMLYHKPSMVCLQMWVLYGLLAGKPFRKIDDIFYYHHESIGTKVFTANESKKLFAKFRDLNIKTVATLYDIRYGRNSYLPRWMICFVPNVLGWNTFIKGKK